MKRFYNVTIEKTMAKAMVVQADDERQAEEMVRCVDIYGDTGFDRSAVCIDVSYTAVEVGSPVEPPVKSKYIVVEYVRRGGIFNHWEFDFDSDAKMFADMKFEQGMRLRSGEDDHFLRYGFWVGVFLGTCSLTEEGEWMPDNLWEFDPHTAYEGHVMESPAEDWEKDINEEENR